MSVNTVRSVNFTPENFEQIKEAKLKKGQLSSWVNDKVKKGLVSEKNPHKIEPIITEGKNLRIKL